jgi:hypothetical protein
MEPEKQLRVALFRTLKTTFPVENLLGMRFLFSGGLDAMFGTITELTTCDDGLPVIEVSNKRFAGLRIKHIVLKDEHKATLITTATEEAYRWFPGTFTLLH